jgi:hypothetical protein
MVLFDIFFIRFMLITFFVPSYIVILSIVVK